ncbi:phospholipase D-like domain-containing protein [Saccharibacillus sp. CPCC 101409]|uniref:phospholipase D-like domain-containing protein n=1 Tax=Saccharibacillus sp. CPCC 101409 TaxID=3058041 RepID=UPI0026713E0E|nr:phospholipase D-like domain-containing protein [Saccharibacillus sp. CPCC 101409]MDO3408915.1 phospholipase D-like domain-containing protein [Saccharibacillus sp. CPCC 101409]
MSEKEIRGFPNDNLVKRDNFSQRPHKRAGTAALLPAAGLALALLLAGCSDTAVPAASAPAAVSEAAGGNAADGSTKIEYAFTERSEDPAQLASSVIDGAQRTLDIAIYNLDSQTLADKMVRALDRGVEVRILTEKSKAEKGSQGKLLQTLKDAGAQIKINTHDGKMHEKISIADTSTVTVGSFNYTDASSEENDEVLVAIHDASVAKDWTDVFDGMWNDTENFAEWEAES